MHAGLNGVFTLVLVKSYAECLFESLPQMMLLS